MTIHDQILKEIAKNNFLSFTKDDSRERYDALYKLEAFGLVTKHSKCSYKLTKDGFKAIDIGGFYNWVNLNNENMDAFTLVLLTLKKYSSTGNFIDLTKENLNIDHKTLKSICNTLKRENKIETKANGEYAISFGDGTTFNNVTGKILARITLTGLESLKKGDSSVNIGNISVINGDKNSVNQSRLDNALESPITQIIKKNNPTKPPKRSILEILAWVTGILAAIAALYEFWLKNLIY